MAKYDLQSILESQVIDPIVAVMAKEDKKLRNAIAGLGTWLGSADTYAGLPTTDQNGANVTAGDTATLTQTDGDHPVGLYRYDGNQWLLEIDYSHLDFANIVDSIKAENDIATDKAVDDKFTTPKDVYDFTTSTFHPKGGDTTLKLVADDAEEGTKEVVNASQLAATFSESDVQTKYDGI